MNMDEIEKLKERIETRIRQEADMRAGAVAQLANQHPMAMLPMDFAVVDGMYMQRLGSIIRKYNMDQYDRLTGAGMRLDLLTGNYKKGGKHE
jgi:hypothetical protein